MLPALEVTNGVLVGQRSKRLHQPEIRRFATLRETLSVVQDVQPLTEYGRNVFPVELEAGEKGVPGGGWPPKPSPSMDRLKPLPAIEISISAPSLRAESIHYRCGETHRQAGCPISKPA